MNSSKKKKPSVSKLSATRKPVTKAKKATSSKKWSPKGNFFSLSNYRLFIFILIFGAIGTYIILRSFALTNTVTYSGSFTKKRPSASYSVTATMDGTLTSTVNYSNVQNFAINVASASGSSLTCSNSGVNPRTISCPVTKGTYTIVVSGIPASKGSGTYTVTISYPVADTVPPTTTITSPASGSTIKGLINIEGNATDNDGVAKVEVSIDGGPYNSASLTGTTTTNQTWNYLLDTTKFTNASHTFSARTTDLTGNMFQAAATYTINNAAPVSDTSPPAVSITSPANNSTVNGTITMSGTSNDNVSVAKVEYSIDSGAYSLASGTSSWSANVTTTGLSNASHTLRVKATDGAGNVSSSSVTVTVSNTTSSTAPNTQGTWVSPEGATIIVNSTGIDPATNQPWTIAGIYSRLKAQTTANAAVSSDFVAISPRYTLNIQDQYAAMTTIIVSVNNGTCGDWQAQTYAKGINSQMTTWPDYIISREYGHAWGGYNLCKRQEWSTASDNYKGSAYRAYRWDHSTYNGVYYEYLSQDPRFDCMCSNGSSSLAFDTSEVLADDYRLLFGSPAAISQRNFSINTAITDPRNQPGLANWLSTTWDGH